MARNKQDWTQAKFERYCKEGRGQGSGKEYQPWIKIHDFPSRGRVAASNSAVCFPILLSLTCC